jgi:DNA-binding IclR family transcriptional regulator
VDERATTETRWALGVRDRERLQDRRPGEATAYRDARRTSGVGVLDRSVAIIDAIEGGARTFTSIAERTGLTRPTAHRLLRALEDHGFVFQVGGLGYALGPRLLGLAGAAMRELPLRDLARPALERLARTTGESAQLYVRNVDRRLCVDAVESAHELRTIVRVGASLPLEKGSAGRVFLAWGAAPEDLDVEPLAQKLATTRRRGWADSHGEREAGVASVSAPVFGPRGTLVAAVSISGPEARVGGLRAKRYARAVLEAAREIETAIGRQEEG